MIFHQIPNFHTFLLNFTLYFLTLNLIIIKNKFRSIMKKLLLIVLIFLIIGTVSAHDDLNSTADNLLKDSEYNVDIDDDDGSLIVEENDYIPVEVNVDEPWSLNVYIDRQDSAINGEFVNMTHNQVDIPTSIMIEDNEVPLSLGKHNILYEFKFTNTTSIYKPDAYITDSGVNFDFKFIRTSKNPQNSIYRFTSQLNIIETIEPIVKILDLANITITYSDSLFFKVKGIRSGEASIYLDDKFVNSYEIDENSYEEEIDTTQLAIGSYNIVCIIKSNNVYAEYNVSADNSNSMINVNFIKNKTTYSPNKYITIINTTLNVCELPELNLIYINTPPIDITYTRSIPVYFEGEGDGKFIVYIDGVKVYDNSILLTWHNTFYIPTKDGEGNYFDVGTHNLSFEFISTDKYSRFNPVASWYNNVLTFNFFDTQDSTTFLNEKYIANTRLNLINKNTQFTSIDSSAIVSIIHTNDINLKIDSLSYSYNLTVFVDDVEIYDSYTSENTINIKTFFERSSIFDTNERDIQIGCHSIRFEFRALYLYDVDTEFKDNTLYFKFTQTDSTIKTNGVYYQFNTSLIVAEKEKTVHILNVKNSTYFDFTEFSVKMDTYKPENNDDWDDDEENPLGTQDVGIIVRDENGIVYIDDYLMNVYQFKQWNYDDFENEKLPKAGKYTIQIINLADNTYDTASFEVKKENRIFNKKYSSDEFNVLFTLDFSSCREDLDGFCHIILDNEEKVINVKKGLIKSKKEVLFKDIDPGVYTATFTLKGNEIYNDVSLKSKVTVKKEEPTISYHKSGGNKLDLTIDIGKSKTDAILIVSAGSEAKKFTINKNTKHITVEFDNLKSGNYNVEIYFKGNERYTSKTIHTSLEITHYSKSPVSKHYNDVKQTKGLGKNTGGISTGSGDSNAIGNGNGTYNGKISFNGKGFNGDFGSKGSGHGDSAKSYEVTKNIIKSENNINTLLIFIIIAFIILFLGFIYKKREGEEIDEY